MVGGLLLSQVLTLYTTPVIYIFFDRIAQRFSTEPQPRRTRRHAPQETPASAAGMSISTPFIRRPVATTLLTVAIAIAGAIAYTVLPGRSSAPGGLPHHQRRCQTSRAPAPRSWPRPSPRRWSASSATSPASREMTSSSSLGSTNITIQFDLSRNIDGAARDVQAAINAARTYLPANLPSNPDLPQGQSGRRAHHDPGPHLRRLQQGPDVRCRLHRPGPEALADRGRRPGRTSAAPRHPPSASKSIPPR